MSVLLLTSNNIEADMNAHLNACPKRDCDLLPYIGFLPNVSPEAQGSPTGEGLEYARQEGFDWFVIRATNNRGNPTVEKVKNGGIKRYVLMHYIQKVKAEKKQTQQPMPLNFPFIYATWKQKSGYVKRMFGRFGRSAFFIKCCMDKTIPKEAGGKKTPLIILYNTLISFIRVRSTDSEHLRIDTEEWCNYKSREIVRVIIGELRGVVGKVARIAGQQRIDIGFPCFALSSLLI